MKSDQRVSAQGTRAGKRRSNFSVGAVSLFFIPVISFLVVFVCFLFSKPPPSLDYGTGYMFNKIAHRYDFINRALSLNMDRGWREVMVKEVTLDGTLYSNNAGKNPLKMEEIKILDLATGTADVAILLAQAYQNQQKKQSLSPIHITGIDPSENMLHFGKTKVARNHLSDLITLTVGDVRNLSSLRDDTFHVATMSFGIRNVPEKDTALCEIHRVLRKEGKKSAGGKLAILEFSEPGRDAGVLGYIARFFIRYMVPVIGAVLSAAPREYIHLQNSIKEFPSPSEFVQLMEGLKCGKKKKGTFRVDKVIQMNFGSVQLYVATPISL